MINPQLTLNYSLNSRALVGNKSIEYYQMKTLDSRFKGAAVGPLSEVIYANQMNHKNFTLLVLPQTIFSFPVAMYFPKNHYLVSIFEDVIGHLQAVGILQFWMNKYYDTAYVKHQIVNTEPKKMNLDHLSGIFIVWMFGCFTSCICCLVEIIFKSFRRKKNSVTKFRHSKGFTQ